MKRSTRSPLWRLPADQEIQEELELHLELLTRDFEAQGLTPEEARRRAEARFGDRKSVEAACRELAGGRDRRRRLRRFIRDLSFDLRSALRQVWRHPRFSSAVILGLGLGLGLTLAVFSWAQAKLFGPLPAAVPERVVTVWEAQPHRNQWKNLASPANFVVWREEASSFEALTGFITLAANLTGEGPSLRSKIRAVTDGYFEVLGVNPILGRTLTTEDFAEERSVVVLSYDFWQRRLGGREDVLGHQVDLDGQPYEVVGVLPGSAALDLGPALRPLTDAPHLYLPLPESEQWRQPRGRWLLVMGRLAEDVSVTEANAEMEALAARLEERFPDFNSRWTARAVPLADHLREAATAPVLGMGLAVTLVLALLVVNMASLMLARMVSRGEELAVRATLGAGRGRLLRQVLLEGALLSGTATALGGLVALGLLGWSDRFLPSELRLETPLELGLPVLLLAGGLALLSALVIGVWPAWLATRQPADRLGHRALGGRSRMRTGLVFAEVALAAVLLMGAGLMLRTVVGLLQVDPGFETTDTQTFALQLPRGTTDPETISFYTRLLERLETLPGVEAAGAVSHLPLASAGAATSYRALDLPEPPPGEAPVADIRVIRGELLEAMGIRLVAGRAFDSRDAAGAETGTVLVDSTVAESLWPGEPEDSLLGRQLDISWGSPDAPARRIVGVVDAVRVKGLDIAPRGTIYFPHDQDPTSAMSVVLRAPGASSDLLALARAEVAALDPELPVFGERSLAAIVAESLGERRFLTRVLGLFAAAALLIAAFGIYAVTSFQVLQRTREIGLRMALGATPRGIALLVVSQVGRLGALALASGLAASLLLGRWVETLLYGVEPFDPATLAGVALVLASSALLAALRPALRAARVAPTRALRQT